jgi:hypothetical protein
LPDGSIRKVERCTPLVILPYMFFSTMTPNASQSFASTSASSLNGISYFALNF